MLDQDSVVVADFAAGDKPWKNLRPAALLPGGPAPAEDLQISWYESLGADATEGVLDFNIR